jgi:hypothetical protein
MSSLHVSPIAAESQRHCFHGCGHNIIVKLVHPILKKSINVDTGLDNHVVKLVTVFHLTLVMNYIAWFGLVVLYPDWTLNMRSLIVTDTPASQKCLSKYIERRYTLNHNMFELTHPLEEHICEGNPYCPTSTRSLYDGHCLVEPFEPDGFEFIACERDMTWSLPVSCAFENLKKEEPNLKI